jgi:SAM-dependent methyltransferase
MKFPESATAHRYLDGLKGIEVGGSAHNPFGLDTINVDRLHHNAPEFAGYAKEQLRLCGEVLRVDVVAHGDRLPFPDKSFDFVVSSHVVEHFFDPIGAIKEWARVARKYIFIIAPRRDALEFDKSRPVTPIQELVERHAGTIPNNNADGHYTRWTRKSFAEMCRYAGLKVVESHAHDDKVGNGLVFVLSTSGKENAPGTAGGKGVGKRCLQWCVVGGKRTLGTIRGAFSRLISVMRCQDFSQQATPARRAGEGTALISVPRSRCGLR